jgi:DNA-binding CsgD family transcriptional regulator
MAANTDVRWNGINRELKVPVRNLADLQAESRRLLFEFLNRTIDITITMAGFNSARPQNKQLRLTSTRMAQKGYERALAMLQTIPAEEPQLEGLQQRLNELRDAISNGGSFTPAAIPVPSAAPKRVEVSPEVEPLTAREREVLQCIAEGHRTKAVARILGMSCKTAACHRYRLMEKLAIHDTANLVRYAIREGIVKV